MTTNTQNPTGTAIETIRRIPTEELRHITSWEEASQLAKGVGAANVADVIGDGFELVDPDILENTELLILDWSFGTSDRFKDENGEWSKFAIVRCITRSERKVFFTDGSGVYRQLSGIDGEVNCRSLYVARGLRKSVFDYVDDKGEQGVGVSWWLNTSAK